MWGDSASRPPHTFDWLPDFLSSPQSPSCFCHFLSFLPPFFSPFHPFSSLLCGPDWCQMSVPRCSECWGYNSELACLGSSFFCSHLFSSWNISSKCFIGQKKIKQKKKIPQNQKNLLSKHVAETSLSKQTTRKHSFETNSSCYHLWLFPLFS